MPASFEEIEEDLPSPCPLTTNFERAILSIKEPIRALSKSIMEMGVSGGMDENLIAIAATIETFLNQLDYVLLHAYVGDTSIMHSEIRHPFKLSGVKKKEGAK